jgi:1,4-alpha-glucan branching enzyme
MKALLSAAPGIPQIFMGQEFREDQQWNWDPTASLNLIWWHGIDPGVNHRWRDTFSSPRT